MQEASFTPQLRPEIQKRGVSTHSTISQDLTQGTGVREEQNLKLLAKNETQLSLKRTQIPGPDSNVPLSTGNHTLQDYQMQLMLLEQQNKKRLMITRRDQDTTKKRLPDNKTDYAWEPSTTGAQSKRPHDVSDNEDQDYTSDETAVQAPPGKRQKSVQTAATATGSTEFGNEMVHGDSSKICSAQLLDPDISGDPSVPSASSAMAFQIEPDTQRRSRSRPRLGPKVPIATSKRDPSYLSFCKVIYRVSCNEHSHEESFFEDLPEREKKYRDGIQHLSGKKQIPNLSQWIFRAGTIAFVIFKEFRCRDSARWDPRRRLASMPNDAQVFRESIALSSEVLQLAVTEISRCAPNDSAYEKAQNPNEAIYYSSSSVDDGEIETYPHRFFYHHRDLLSNYANSLGIPARDHVNALLSYIQASKGEVFDEADRLIDQGRIHRSHIEMLFCPNDIVIAKIAGHQAAYVLRAWPRGGSTIFLDCWAWGFDGNWLHRKSETLTILRPAREIISVRDLDVYPIRFATVEELDQLRTRGQKFWGLRYQSFVTYTGWDAKAEQFYSNEARCMIDYRTYRKFHPAAHAFIFSTKSKVLFDPWPESISHNTQLDESNLILLPHQIHAFPLKSKKWFSFLVDNVGPVTWNKEAYERLVLPERTKDLVKALVMVRTSARGFKQGMSLVRKRDDLIAGKGNGLIMLLHGGPGTGKASLIRPLLRKRADKICDCEQGRRSQQKGSVAEIAEMPLYSVTCGDIGTRPEVVESYLESVFTLGKAWNCVLLLDEADVFLEERTLSDLERNSLVSVFLRSLEYYDGILILTSNRVGIFDEAFKSRIQVALHYPKLDSSSRRKIWQNFLDMMQADKEDANIRDLERHLDELANQEMNGRQIRNVLTTARQLALFRRQTLDWDHVEQALKPAGDFQRYLEKVQGHTDEQWAMDKGVRG